MDNDRIIQRYPQLDVKLWISLYHVQKNVHRREANRGQEAQPLGPSQGGSPIVSQYSLRRQFQSRLRSSLRLKRVGSVKRELRSVLHRLILDIGAALRYNGVIRVDAWVSRTFIGLCPAAGDTPQLAINRRGGSVLISSTLPMLQFYDDVLSGRRSYVSNLIRTDSAEA